MVLDRGGEGEKGRVIVGLCKIEHGLLVSLC